MVNCLIYLGFSLKYIYVISIFTYFLVHVNVKP